MKRILSLFAIIMAVAIGANAQEYTWKKVTGTSVPEDFYEGATAEEAKAYIEESYEEGALYGAIPADGMFSAYLCSDATGYEPAYGTISWADAAENGMMYYPAKKSTTPGSNNCTLDENGDITSNYQTGDTFSKVTLKRTMARYLADGTTKRWHTIAFPFTMSAEQIEANFGSNAKLVKLTSIADNTINFETATEIEEETLYLLQLGDLSEDVETIELDNVTMTAIYGEYATNYSVQPVYEASTIWADDFLYAFYTIGDNEFKFVDADQSITATQWYIQTDVEDTSWAKTLQLNIDSIPTSISTLHLNDHDTATKLIINNRVVIRKGNNSYTTTGVEIK